MNPQHAFNFGSEPFRLVPEETQDGERIQREAEQRLRDQAESESKQTSLVEVTP